MRMPKKRKKKEGNDIKANRRLKDVQTRATAVLIHIYTARHIYTQSVCNTQKKLWGRNPYPKTSAIRGIYNVERISPFFTMRCLRYISI